MQFKLFSVAFGLTYEGLVHEKVRRARVVECQASSSHSRSGGRGGILPLTFVTSDAVYWICWRSSSKVNSIGPSGTQIECRG